MININYLRADFLFSLLWKFSLLIKETVFGWHNHSSSLLTLIFILVFVSICTIVFRKIINLVRYLRQESIFLELTPPALTEKSSYTTQQLFSVLHNIGIQRTWFDRILGEKVTFSFEIVSTKDKGIRYIIRSSHEEASLIEHTIVSYLPQVKVNRINEYLPLEDIQTTGKVIEFKQRKHFAFPLAKQNVLNQHDPVAYITGMMTKLQENELISFQIIVSPVKIREADILSQRILRNEEILEYLNKPRIPIYLQPVILIFKAIINLISVTIREIGWVLTEIAHGTSPQQKYIYSYMQQQDQLVAQRIRPARVLSSFEQEAVEGVQKKVEQDLFETTIRALVIVNGANNRRERIRGIKSSLAPFSIPKYQSLRALNNYPPIIADKMRFFTFKNRLLSLVSNKSSSLLSVSEISDFYHFPFSETTRTENIVKNLSTDLPAPISLKNDKKLDVVFGINTYGNSMTNIGLTDSERAKHMYLIGQTGSGKSTIIFHMASQDMQKGRGVAVVDPHGDLARDLLYCVPQNRINDVIYFNPFDLGFPVGINLLELPNNLSDDELELEKELVCESVISIFRRVFSNEENKNAHRIEYILRNTIYTSFSVKDRTIFTIYDLLNNPDYQKTVIANLEDENLQNFWKYEFGRAGNYQIVKMVGGVTAKVGRFLFSPTAKRILEQKKSTISFDEIINQGKILICNLSEGKLGEDTSQLLGTTIISKIQQAALRRERMEIEDRKPYYLFVDEFQNFATTSFTRMLSGGRKYGLRITIAEQSTAQQEERRIVNIILANTGTVICFRTASPLDEQLMLVQFSPYIQREDIVNLPNFKFYMKVSATKPEEPFSGETLKISVVKDKKIFEEIIQASRKNYAIVYKKPVKKITKSKPKSTADKSIEESTSDISTL